MRGKELFRLVWINIVQNKFKAIMTSIGIVVGAATIVMVIAIGKGGQADVADQFKNLNAGAIDISYGNTGSEGSGSSGASSDMGGSDTSGMSFGGMPSGDMGGSDMPSGDIGGGNAPSGDMGGGDMPSGDSQDSGGNRGGMMDFSSLMGQGSDMQDRMNQEKITLTEEDVDDIETFVSGISAATISFSSKSSVDGGDLDEATSYTIAGVKSNYEAISNLSLSVGEFITDTDEESKEKVCVLGYSVAEEIFGSAIDAYGSAEKPI